MGQRTNWTEGEYLEYLRRKDAVVQEIVKSSKPSKAKGKPNATEAEFLLQLKADYPQLDFLFEEVKLRIDDGCWYTPDYFCPEMATFYEVKGPHIWDDSKVKFKAARRIHAWARFQMHQKKDGTWKRLH
jgi:hypothetical protein